MRVWWRQEDWALTHSQHRISQGCSVTDIYVALYHVQLSLGALRSISGSYGSGVYLQTRVLSTLSANRSVIRCHPLIGLSHIGYLQLGKTWNHFNSPGSLVPSIPGLQVHCISLFNLSFSAVLFPEIVLLLAFFWAKNWTFLYMLISKTVQLPSLRPIC